MSSLLMSLLKTFFFTDIVFFMSKISIWHFFFKFNLSAKILHLFMKLFTFPTISFNVWTILILMFWPQSSNIYVFSVSTLIDLPLIYDFFPCLFVQFDFLKFNAWYYA